MSFLLRLAAPWRIPLIALLATLLGFATPFATPFAAAQSLTGATAAGQSTAGGIGDSLRGALSGLKSQPELLPPDEAFRIELRATGPDRLIARLIPAKDYYLYRDRISFSVQQPAGLSIARTSLPKGEPKEDPTFGTVEVYHQPLEAVILLAGSAASGSPVQLLASFQGCNDPVGVCYPPIEKVLTVALPSGPASVDASGSATATLAPAPAAATAGSNRLDDENTRIGELFAGSSRWALVAAFFGFGILLAFTPCMLPMIPILSGIIVGHGAAMTRRHAVGLSAVYVLAMAITYALAGVAAGLAGTMLSAWMQNAWVLGSFAAIFVLLSLSMFGLYELQLPAALQTRLSSVGRHVRGGRAAGAFVMGVLSAVIIGPCVAAPLAGALLYIGQSRDGVLGGTALFAMAIGMGVPLMLVGATAGSLLPKAGPWMESVKRVFGVTMLAVAIWMITPVIPLVAQQLLWAALLIVAAIYLHALDPLPPHSSGYRRLLKGVGVISLLLGAASMVGALSGSRELLQP
ncbi:MAG: protein-disulfide reductase DsbD, partial [Ideonella sp.]